MGPFARYPDAGEAQLLKSAPLGAIMTEGARRQPGNSDESYNDGLIRATPVHVETPILLRGEGFSGALGASSEKVNHRIQGEGDDFRIRRSAV